MAANIFGERFYSLRRKPWHVFGTVSETEMGARDAFTTIGAYDVRLEDMRTASGLPVENKAVVRSATPDDPQERVLSVVGADYVLVSPGQVVDAWDQTISRPIETIGALGKGDTLFLTTKLPTLDVKGDEIENYLLLSSPMTGADAIWARVTPVRVVCQNTLIAAAAAATEKHRVLHDSRAVDRMKLWLDHLWNKAIDKMNLQNAAFRAMADRPVDSADRDLVLEMVYTMPALPRRADMPEPIYVEKLAQAEYNRERMGKKRAGVVELFDGKGRGMDTPAARGTAWGLYNAVVEMEDYGGTGKGAVVAESALVGDRARTKAAAYDAVMSIVK